MVLTCWGSPGSFGAVPRPVQRFCNELTNKVEANPDRYHRFSFKPLLVDSRERIAQLVGAHTDECVFVSNATAAINTIMRNLEWNANDIIIQSAYPFTLSTYAAYSLNNP